MSALSKSSVTTLIASGKLVCVPSSSLGDLLENLIGQELSNHEFLKGRSYLCEDASSQLNNLYFCLPSSPAEGPIPSLAGGARIWRET